MRYRIPSVLAFFLGMGWVLCVAPSGTAAPPGGNEQRGVREERPSDENKGTEPSRSGLAYGEAGTYKGEKVSEGTPCLSGFFTVGYEPNGGFECNGDHGLALYGHTDKSSGGTFLRRADLRFKWYYRIGSWRGWVYEEQAGGPKWLWFFSVPNTPNGVSVQFWSTDGVPAGRGP